MKRAWMLALAAAFAVAAQERAPRRLSPVDEATADAVIAKSATSFPKFHAAFEDARQHDKLIRQIVFVRAEGRGHGPAFAAPNGVIRIDISFLEDPKPNFDDNRMVVVLEHEIGHLHYFETTSTAVRTPENSEKAAFEYSLKITRAMAEKGDCAPLQTGLRFMKLRSEGNNLADAHVRALKRMVHEPLYAEYVDWARVHCGTVAVGQ